MSDKKNPAAVALGKKRWAGMNEEQIAEAMRAIATRPRPGRAKSKTPRKSKAKSS